MMVSVASEARGSVICGFSCLQASQMSAAVTVPVWMTSPLYAFSTSEPGVP